MILAPVAQHFFDPCASDLIRKSVSAIWRWPAGTPLNSVDTMGVDSDPLSGRVRL